MMIVYSYSNRKQHDVITISADLTLHREAANGRKTSYGITKDEWNQLQGIVQNPAFIALGNASYHDSRMEGGMRRTVSVNGQSIMVENKTPSQPVQQLLDVIQVLQKKYLYYKAA